MKILGISGSLRAALINSALVRATARLAPSDMRIALLSSLGELPLLNPDMEPPAATAIDALYAAVAEADTLLIACPEIERARTSASCTSPNRRLIPGFHVPLSPRR